MKEPEFSRVEIPLDEPHFDAETTVLHAQPVIPLDTVRSQTRARRNMFLVIALVGALMMGAVGGTLIHRRQSVRAEPATSESAATEPPMANADSTVAAGGATEEVVKSDTAGETATRVSAPPAEDASEPRRSDPKQPAVRRTAEPETVPSRQETVVKKQQRVEPRETAAEPDWDEMMREARRAARRRRVERREQRARQESDGASRIRDIFEGPNP